MALVKCTTVWSDIGFFFVPLNPRGHPLVTRWIDTLWRAWPFYTVYHTYIIRHSHLVNNVNTNIYTVVLVPAKSVETQSRGSWCQSVSTLYAGTSTVQ